MFTDSTSAIGSFVWDEASNKATSWNIVTVNGSKGGVTYSNATGISFANSSINTLYFSQGLESFRIIFADLNNLDTPVASLTLFSQNGGQTGANGFLECTNCSPYRLGLAGAYLSATPTASDVPEPSSIALFGLAFGLIGVARLRKA